MAFESQIVRYGSSGDSVKKLQNMLNQNGYTLDEDGVFGNNTLTAVKDYQTKSGLDVDGIVGEQTWGSLTSGSASKTNNETASKGFSYDAFSYDDYTESDTVTQALAALNSQLGAKPSEYQSTWQDQINSIIDKILNREEFSYDLNSDALYQQYKDQYTALGKLAMQDTMGQAAAMTGGYGNSYASTAGNQAYQSYLSQLNEVVPELYGMALDRYNQEGEELYNNYALLSDQENQDYSRYQDEYNQWLTGLQLYYDQYNTERNFDYNKYATERDYAYGVYSDDKSYAYNEYTNAIANEQWQKEFDLSVDQWEWQKEQYEKEAESTTKSYSGTTSSGVSYNNGSLTNSQVKELQAALGVNADGKYGPASQKAAGGLTAEEAYAKYVGGTGAGNTKTEGVEEDTASKTGSISDTIRQKVANYTTKKGQANYVAELVNSGEITEDQALALLNEYEIRELTDSNWEVIDDGGTNWWGIDQDAAVRNENGQEYTMKELQKELEKTMSRKEAKSYIKKLQKELDF